MVLRRETLRRLRSPPSSTLRAPTSAEIQRTLSSSTSAALLCSSMPLD